MSGKSMALLQSKSDPFVIEKKEGERYQTDGSDGVPSLYQSLDDAQWVLSQMNHASQVKRIIREASAYEKTCGRLVVPKRKRLKANCLVEVYENFDSRKFAVSSRAQDEAEFLIEFAHACSMLPHDSETSEMRLRELLPLVVDICCKYRGYKSDKVQQRMILVAGDLEIPSLSIPVEVAEAPPLSTTA